MKERDSHKAIGVGLALLAGLFLLRLPFLGGVAFFLYPHPPWLLRAYEISTYALTALLIWWERDRWPDFHLGAAVVGLFICAPALESAFWQIPLPGWDHGPPLRWPEIGIAAGLLLALLVWRPRPPAWRWSAVLWVLLGAGAGIGLGVGTGCLFRLLESPRGPAGSLWLVPPLVISQLTRAATYEEPFFRGFLWGYLRKLGLREVWIWLLQAGLFMLAHIYYVAHDPLSFWVVVPLGGLVFGLLAWRSRSIGSSMVAHGFVNAVGDLVAHYQW